MGFIDYWKKIRQGEQVVGDEMEKDNVTGIALVDKNNSDIFKAYIPNFLYKPPYGFPRREPVQTFRVLAKNAYIFSVIKTLCDEATANEWSIQVKEEFLDDGNDYTEKINEITRFFNNPNGNDESFEHLLRQLITDLLEVDSAVLVKIFNTNGEFKQLFSRDGALFLKNPDIYGYMGNRAEFVAPLPDGFTGVNIDFGGTPTQSQQQLMKTYSLAFKERAAYFQYGWTAGSLPVPFGKREIVYMMQMPRSDTIYGTSPISRLQETIQTLIYGADSQLDLYTNSNIPEGVISLLGAQREQLTQFRENFEKQFKFKDALGNDRKQFHKIPLATTDVKFTPFALTAKEMEFISQQTWFTKIVWMCFGVNADEMGFTENSNRAVGESQIKTFKRKAIKPLLSVIQYHLNNGILPEFFSKGTEIPEISDIPLKFVFDTVDIMDTKQELDVYEQKIRMGIMTPEMVAKELGIDIDELQESREEEMDRQAVANGYGPEDKFEEEDVTEDDRVSAYVDTAQNDEDDDESDDLREKKTAQNEKKDTEEKSRTRGARDKRKRKRRKASKLNRDDIDRKFEYNHSDGSVSKGKIITVYRDGSVDVKLENGEIEWFGRDEIKRSFVFEEKSTLKKKKLSSKKVEEKANNPLKEIENYIDDIGKQLEKAVGNLKNEELNQTF